METTKPYDISKHDVVRAWELVKGNQGASGIDGETIEQFESDLKGNLYKLWNRMSSGSYFPPAVKTVAIPKKTGGVKWTPLSRQKMLLFRLSEVELQRNSAALFFSEKRFYFLFYLQNNLE